MRQVRRFISREKQVFLVGFSLTFLRFPRLSKNRLNTSLNSFLRKTDSLEMSNQFQLLMLNVYQFRQERNLSGLINYTS